MVVNGRNQPPLRLIVTCWLLGFCALSPGPGAAQLVQSPPRRIDSLQTLLRGHPQPDSVRLERLNDLGDEITEVNKGAAGNTRRETVRLARQVRYRDFLAEALLNLADYHIALAQYDSASAPLEKSRREFVRLRDLGGQMRGLGRLARIADQ